MPKPKNKFMDVLEAGLSEDDEGTSSSGSAASGAEPGAAAEQQDDGDDAGVSGPALPKRAKKRLTVTDLERVGYQSGPSVLYMRAPQEQGQSDWTWSNGREARAQEGNPEDEEDRAATREAVTKGVEKSAELAIKAMEHTAKLREEKRAEEAERKIKLTFNQKEKRKRDAGQQSREKNYVEESKRQAREFGVFSGFD